MSESAEALAARFAAATKAVNTAICWSVRATKVEFAPEVDTSSLVECAGVTIDGDVMTFECARIWRTTKQFKIFVGSFPVGLDFPFWSIVRMWDEDGVIWQSG